MRVYRALPVSKSISSCWQLIGLHAGAINGAAIKMIAIVVANQNRLHLILITVSQFNLKWNTFGKFYAAGSGPAATSFLPAESTAKLRPSSVRAPRKDMSPGSANTTSSIVNSLPTRRKANPTLRVITSPFAIAKRRSFFSLTTPICSSLALGIHVYSLPVSTRVFAIRTPLSRCTWFQPCNLCGMCPYKKFCHSLPWHQPFSCSKAVSCRSPHGHSKYGHRQS